MTPDDHEHGHDEVACRTDGGVAVDTDASTGTDADGDEDDDYPETIIISRPRPSRGRFHRVAPGVDEPMPACSANLRSERADWYLVERQYFPFPSPCLNPACFGDPKEDKRGSYTVTHPECEAINTLRDWNVSWPAISRLTGVAETTCHRHAGDQCWHKVGRHHQRTSQDDN